MVKGKRKTFAAREDLINRISKMAKQRGCKSRLMVERWTER